MRFAAAMAGTGAAFFKQVPKETMGIYFQALEPWSIESIEFALCKSIKECDNFPPVKKLIELAGMYRRPVNSQYNEKQIAAIFCTEEEAKENLKELYRILGEGVKE